MFKKAVFFSLRDPGEKPSPDPAFKGGAAFNNPIDTVGSIVYTHLNNYRRVTC